MLKAQPFPKRGAIVQGGLLGGLLFISSLSPLRALAMDEEARTMSLNTEVIAVPAPGPVTIDGNTDDWDLSAGVWSYNNPMIVERFSVWTHLMWDDKGIYFLARFADATPMQNPATGKDFSNSWKSDCYQARVIFDDGTPEEHQMHINMFYSAPEQHPYLIVSHGGFGAHDATGPARSDQAEKYGPTMEAAGGKVACQKWANGKGYNIEAFWPWGYCRTSKQPLKPGEQFTFGIEGLWNGHRLADGIKNDGVNRIFMFNARTGWGRALISSKGRLDITTRQLALQAARLKRFVNYDSVGSIPLAYTLPEDRDVTIAIDNAAGVRVRNLFGQYPRKAGTVTDRWDGQDDNGKPVPPGAYTATLVDHQPVTLRLLNSVYNAGTPPWITEDGNRTWGSNHGHPTGFVSRDGVKLALFIGSEGTPGLLRVDDQDRVIWTAVDELCDATLDTNTVYALTRNFGYGASAIQKYTVEGGKIILFNDAAKSPYMALQVKIGDVREESSIALANNTLYALVLGPNKLFQIQPDTGAILATTDSGDLVAVKDRNGTLYGLYKDGTVATLKADASRDKVLFTAAVKGPMRLGISHDGARFAISASGSNQVFIYDAKGKRQEVIGRVFTGNDRPAGKFVETDMICPLGLDFDAQGNLWVAEAQGHCRRITRWTPDGALQHSFWGGADYGAMSGYALTYDSTRFIGFGVEFQLDPKPDPLHKGTMEKPLYYHPDLAGRGYVYKIGPYEYAARGPEGDSPLSIAKRGKDGIFRLCASLRVTANNKPGQGWCDRNDNGQVDPDEVTTNPAGKNVYWSCGWIRPDLTIMTADEWTYPCKGFTKGGVPLYDFTAPVKPANAIAVDDTSSSRGTIIMDLAGNISDGISFATKDGRRGAYPNRYGRHDAPAAQRGVIIAAFRANGVVEDVPAIGSIMALGGDRGEWFLSTMDGLYLSSICQDTKGDVTLDETFIGQESFGGLIWRDERGRILVQLGGPAFRIMEVQGLDTCRKTVIKLNVTQAQIDAGARLVAGARKGAGSEPTELTMARVKQLPAAPRAADLAETQPLQDGVPEARVTADGNASRWWRAAFMHDGTTLGILWQVADDSPWKNGEGRFTHAFIGGDGLDLKLDVPGRGPIRLLAAPVSGKNVAVYWQQKGTPQENPTTYSVNNNPGNAKTFDVVRLLPNAQVKVATGISGYTALLTVPLADLGLTPGASLKGVAGVIYSTPSGDNRLVRLYWFDKQTDMVSDVPSEAGLDAGRMGPVMVQP